MHETTIMLPENAGISSATELRHKLLAALGKATAGSSITIDGSQTNIADSSLAQLLLSFKAEASANDVQLTLTGLKEKLSLQNLLCSDATDESLLNDAKTSNTKGKPSGRGSP